MADMTKPVASMTMAELQEFIIEVVERRQSSSELNSVESMPEKNHMADMTKPVASMTVAELEEFIIEVVDRMQSGTELIGWRQGLQGEALRQLIHEMYERLFVPPPGAKSSLEMLREDRDS